jgi:hypothetical protein
LCSSDKAKAKTSLETTQFFDGGCGASSGKPKRKKTKFNLQAPTN